ncbi:DNase I-like protein [Sistotremastrum niveocremeum HHB9708]|uniref:DNase I-like protein n=1 Tax=Sistotremastrum niveocremeum HHB9708 TaxID=1314777 RepID=A0A164PBF0_9AGAM|nr:DNase I-like protein [Sistotremastrum niveocremeum HHB9708]
MSEFSRLLPPDHFLSVYETITVPNTYDNDDAGQTVSRKLAVITRNGQGLQDTSGVLLVKERPNTRAGGPPVDFAVLSVLPVTSKFRIKTSQRAIKMASPSPNAKAADDVIKGFSIEFENGPEKFSFWLSTSDFSYYKPIIAELRRLSDLCETFDSLVKWSWLTYYSRGQYRLMPLFHTPQDLRVLNEEPPLSPIILGSQGVPDHDVSVIQDHWIQQRMIERKSEYAHLKEVSIRLCSFNVNGRPPNGDLEDWILGKHVHRKPSSRSLERLDVEIESGLDLSSEPESPNTACEGDDSATLNGSDDPYPDIIVVSFQEMDLSTEGLLYATAASVSKGDAWISAISEALSFANGVSYLKIASKQLVGLFMCIFIKEQFASEDITEDISTCAVGTGILGVMANKGAVGISLTFPGTSTRLSFINSHLAAFDEMLDKRNADFHELSRRLRFVDKGGSDRSAFESHVLFWMVVRAVSLSATSAAFMFLTYTSDLNYRIELPQEDVRALMSDKSEHRTASFQTLQTFDQLLSSRQKGLAFKGFHEAPINFLPTYRFAGGYGSDDLGYDLKRRPAWTDRILYLSSPMTHVIQTSYNSHPDVMMSDHKPISAEFSITTHRINETKQASVLADILSKTKGTQIPEARQAEDDDRRSIPRLRLSPSTIEVGDIRYDEPKEAVLTLENIGQTACAWRIIPKSMEGAAAPDWLSVTPTFGMVPPNSSCNVHVKIHVNAQNARALNEGVSILDETVILHVVGGQDHFLQVCGNYQGTCFGNDLNWLVRLPCPVREFAKDRNQWKLLPENGALSCPRELGRLLEWLMSNAVTVDDLCIQPGDPQVAQRIRESLDTGDEFDFIPAVDKHTLALAFGETLMQFLNSLSEPLIPWSLHGECVNATTRDMAFAIIHEMTSYSASSLVSITAFLHFLSLQSSKETTDRIQDLVLKFAPILLRDPPQDAPELVASSLSPLQKRRFVEYFFVT